jgi:tetratricopeptide (TPR) repeat protein
MKKLNRTMQGMWESFMIPFKELLTGLVGVSICIANISGIVTHTGTTLIVGAVVRLEKGGQTATMRAIRTGAILPILMFFLISNTPAQPFLWIDSTEASYSIAATGYDRDALRKTAEFITQKTIQEQQAPRALLLLGFILWRQELIAYCLNTHTEVGYYGKMAIETLNKAEKAGADRYLTASHKALACQLMAGQSISKGAVFGPRAAGELKKAQALNPQGYYSLLIGAINANQAPSFAGGNPKKAVILLEKMATDFPDSTDVKIHLADAYSKVGRSEDAYRLITLVTKANPSNLLARKIAAKLPVR